MPEFSSAALSSIDVATATPYSSALHMENAYCAFGLVILKTLHLMNYIESKTDNNKELFVSLNKLHDRLTESGVELRLRERGKKLGVEKVHPHKFRRTMATRAIEKGMPIEQVQKIYLINLDKKTKRRYN